MKKVSRHNFTRFPYRSDIMGNDDVNNGGIDLTAEPDRISEIHEAKDYPWLERFLSRINSRDGLFMTFGCVAGYFNGSFCGYIDFSLRPESPSSMKDNLVNLDEQFYEYLYLSMPEEEIRLKGMEYARKALRWTLSPLEIRDVSYVKVNLSFDTDKQEGAEWAVDHLCFFLTQTYPLLPLVKSQ